MRSLFTALLSLPLFSLCPFAASAEVPRVVTDIAPLHSLVAQVMGDLGEPEVLVSGAASPHDFQFTFAQAGAVQDADLVIWAGAGLTPWLQEALETLAPDTERLTLLETNGWPKLELRDWDDSHDHGDEDHEEDDHSDHEDDHTSQAGTTDPHAWVDPTVAAAWVRQIGIALAEMDPENADTYAANTANTIARLEILEQEITAQLAPLPDVAFLVPHDAYQYFGARFNRPAVGAISPADGQIPSPAKISELQNIVREHSVVCVLSDPQARSEWSDLVREGTPARTAVADPMGGAFADGPEKYEQLMRGLAAAYVDCLSESE